MTAPALDRLLLKYGRSSNPYYVWTAIAVAGELKVDLPAWVIDYLTTSARAMVHPKAKRASESHHIAKSLGFGVGQGKTGLIEKAEVELHYEGLARMVQVRIEAGDKLYLALESVAKLEGLPTETVRRAYRAIELP